MKILIIGSTHEAAMEHHYVRHLCEMGIQNELFGAQNLFHEYYYASLLNKIKYRLGVSRILDSVNETLIRKADAFKPDVLLVFKGMEVFPKTLQRLKKQRVRLVNYNPDNPFLFSGSGSGNKNVSASISLFDLYISYDRRVVQQLEQRGVHAGIIPFGFEISEQQMRECKQEKEILHICFLGNPDKTRAAFINQLAEAGLPIDVYGSGWDRFKIHESVQQNGPVYGNEFWKTLRKYRVQLNLMRPHNLQSHNMRSIEVPAIGGIGLFPATPDHSDFFTEEKEVFLYRNVEECISKARKILDFSEKDAETIRDNARERSIRSGYSYKDRTKTLVEYLERIA